MWHGTGGGLGRWSAVALLVAAGCNRMDGRIPVTGRVTLDGKPVFGVVVRFYASPETKGNGGYGVADASGRFTAKTLQGRPGLYSGDYAITLEYIDVFMTPETEAARVNIPAGYANSGGTPWKITVAPPRAELDLQATSGGK
jgi:hypothetical protein